MKILRWIAFLALVFVLFMIIGNVYGYSEVVAEFDDAYLYKEVLAETPVEYLASVNHLRIYQQSPDNRMGYADYGTSTIWLYNDAINDHLPCSGYDTKEELVRYVLYHEIGHLIAYNSGAYRDLSSFDYTRELIADSLASILLVVHQ